MARIHKQPPKQNLASLPVLIEDDTTFSEYFEINDLNKIFHAGRNGFLIRGTEFLRASSRITIEIVDRFGHPVFATPVTNYTEGGSRLVSIEVYQDTPRGPGRLIIVGEASRYTNGTPIPSEWQGRLNVRWSTPIQIEPNNENRTRIRLANEPTAIVNEENFDITRVDETEISISDYTASLTYDYEVEKSDGYAIEMISSSGEPKPFFDEDNIEGVFTGSLIRRVVKKLYDSGVEVPESSSVIDSYRTASVSLSLYDVLNEFDAITLDTIQFDGEDFPTTNLISGSFEYVIQTSDLGNNLIEKTVQEYTSSVTFDYTLETVTSTASTSSIVNFRIPFVQTHTGEISRVKITAKEANQNIEGFKPFAEFEPGEKNILITTSSIGNVGIGDFSENNVLQNNWHAAELEPNGTFNQDDYEATESVNYPLTILTSSTNILEGAIVDSTQSSDNYFFGTKYPIQLYERIVYTLKYTAVYNPQYTSGSTTFNTDQLGDLDVYLTRTGADSASRAESAVVVDDSDPYGRLIDEIDTTINDKSLYEREVNFRVLKNGLAHLRFISNEGFWSFGNIEITPAVEKGFNPDEIVFYAENNIITDSTNIFKIQFLNWNDEPIDYQLLTSPIFISGARDPGLDGFTINLSNESHTFPSTPSGSVLSYEDGGTDIEVFNGNTPLNATLSTPIDGEFSSSIVSASNITVGTPTASDTVFSYDDPSGMPDSINSASVRYKITAKFANSSYTFIKKQGFTKALSGISGSDGTSPINFSISPTSQTVAAGTDGSVPGTFQDIVISGSEGTNSLVYNQSPTLGNGEYKITDVSGSITVADTTPSTQVIQITAASENTNKCAVFVEFKTFNGITGVTALYFTVTKSIEGATGDPGEAGQDGEIYYIKPLDGRSFKIDPVTEEAVPESLRFQTIRNLGTITQSIASSSAFGLFYSKSGAPVSQSENSYTYQVEPSNILGHDSLEFISESIVLDTIDVSDVTDGISAIYPVLEIEGALTFISGSDNNITPNAPSKITGSAYKGQNIFGTVHAEIGPDNNQITGSIISSSTKVSGSFETFIEGTKIRNVNFLLFSGSGVGAQQIAKETFYLIKDGQAGLTGSNAVAVFASPSSQFVSESSDGGTFADPTDFKITVTEQAEQYSYDAGLSANQTFYINVIQSGSNTNEIVTPDPITEQGQYEVRVEVYYKDLDGNSTTNPLPITHSMTTGRDGAAGEMYFIRPLDGRSFRSDPNTGDVDPQILRFETVQSEGSLIQTINSSSEFGLFYSTSGAPVSQSGNAYTYQVEPINILGHDSLEYTSASVVVDTIDVTDITDGINSTYPLLSVDGVLTFVSSSDGSITPIDASQITASLYKGITELGYVYAEVGPTPQDEITGSVITESGDASGSFRNITKDGTVRNVTFSFFSGSTELANETFYLSIDGKAGEDGQDGKDGDDGKDALTVYPNPSSQIVSQSTDGTIDDPQDFEVVVIQGENRFVYDPTPDANSEFKLTVTQNGSLAGGGYVTPTTPPAPGIYETHVEVEFTSSYGTASTFPYPITHSITTVLDGESGPGVVFTGVWDTGRTYQFSTGATGRRDVVLWSSDGNEPYDTYYATLQEADSTIDPPHITEGTYWESLGTEDYFVAAKIGLFEESFIENTLNVGADSRNGVSSANITLAGGSETPYISIGQTTQDYNESGIFIGSGSAAKMSLISNTGGLLFDGSDLLVSGSISASSGDIAGTLTVGGANRVVLGPQTTPPTPTIDSVELTPTANNVIVTEYTDPLGTQFDYESEPYAITESVQQYDQIRYTITFRTGSGYEDVDTSPRITLAVSQSGFTNTEYEIPDPTDSKPITTRVVYYSPLDDVESTDVSASIVIDGTIRCTNDCSGAGPGTPFDVYEYDITTSYAEPATAVNNAGIFVDWGEGPQNLLSIALSGIFIGDTTNDPAGSSSTLQEVTDNGASTNNIISITNTTDSTSVGTGALTIDGGVGIDKHIVVGLSGSATDWVATSDIRLKNVIDSVDYGLAEIMKMSPILYNWKDEARGTGLRVGLSAQNIQKIIPEAVYGSEDTYYTLSYDSLIPVLINAIKELKEEVDLLRQKPPPDG